MSRLPLLHLTKGLQISPSKTFHYSSNNKTVLKSRNLTKLTLSHETDHEIESSQLFIVPKIKNRHHLQKFKVWPALFGLSECYQNGLENCPPPKKQLNKREKNWNWTIAPDQMESAKNRKNPLYQELASAFFGLNISMFSLMLSSGNPETQHASGVCFPSFLAWGKEICMICMYFCLGFFTESK